VLINRTNRIAPNGIQMNHRIVSFMRVSDALNSFNLMIRQLEASFCPILNNFEKKYRVARKPARNLRISDGYPLIVRKLQQNKQIVGRVSLRDSAGRSHSHLSSPNGANRSLRLNRAIINNGKGFCSPPAKGHLSGISKIASCDRHNVPPPVEPRFGVTPVTNGCPNTAFD